MFCSRCGARRVAGAAYCQECGQPLAASVASVTTMVSDAANPVAAAAIDDYPLVRQGVAPMPAPAWTNAPAVTATPSGININISLNAGSPAVPVLTPPAAPPMNAPGPVFIVQDQGSPHLIVRALWFLLVGWYVGLFYILLAWSLNLTILGLPLGLTMLNHVPAVMTLKRRTVTTNVVYANGVTYMQTNVRPPQAPFLARAAYFLLVGWWVSLLWLLTAWLLGVSIIGLPASFWMFDQVPLVTTLANY